MYLVVTMGMPIEDPPQRDPQDRPIWPRWVAEHFEFLDQQGAAVDLRRRMQSPLISHLEVRGLPDIYLVATFRPGAEYCFDYIPAKSKPQ